MLLLPSSFPAFSISWFRMTFEPKTSTSSSPSLNPSQIDTLSRGRDTKMYFLFFEANFVGESLDLLLLLLVSNLNTNWLGYELLHFSLLFVRVKRELIWIFFIHSNDEEMRRRKLGREKQTTNQRIVNREFHPILPLDSYPKFPSSFSACNTFASGAVLPSLCMCFLSIDSCSPPRNLWQRRRIAGEGKRVNTIYSQDDLPFGCWMQLMTFSLRSPFSSYSPSPSFILYSTSWSNKSNHNLFIASRHFSLTIFLSVSLSLSSLFRMKPMNEWIYMNFSGAICIQNIIWTLPPKFTPLCQSELIVTSKNVIVSVIVNH